VPSGTAVLSGIVAVEYEMSMSERIDEVKSHYWRAVGWRKVCQRRGIEIKNAREKNRLTYVAEGGWRVRWQREAR
jgi:phage gp29-like protein